MILVPAEAAARVRVRGNGVNCWVRMERWPRRRDMVDDGEGALGPVGGSVELVPYGLVRASASSQTSKPPMDFGEVLFSSSSSFLYNRQLTIHYLTATPALPMSRLFSRCA